MEHHPNFWNTTPLRILGQLFGTPPHRRNNETPTGQGGGGGGSGATFWNTTPSSRRATNQTARNTIYGEGSGATFGTPPHRAAGPRPLEWGLRDHFSMRADQVAARNNHVCQLGQSGGSGPLFNGDTEPQQCLLLQPLLSPAVFSLSSL